MWGLLLIGWAAIALTACAGRAPPQAPADGGAPAAVNDRDGATDAGAARDAGGRCDEASLGPIYERIERILSDEHADSCNACHLGGLDLAAFARPTPCETMACLVELGWADLTAPDDSLIFDFISRAEGADGGVVDGGAAQGISAASVQAEHEAFRAWIVFSSQCHDAMCGVSEAPCGPALDGGVGSVDAAASDAGPALDGGALACGPPPLPDAGPDCTFDAELERFTEQVWTWKGRCAHCHAEDAELSIGDPPPWMAASDDAHAPERTMCSVAARGYLDVDAPEKSLLLLKPLREQYGGVMHGGGSKFLSTGDAAYVGFRSYIEAWAACRRPPVALADAGSADVDAGALLLDSGSIVGASDAGAPP